MSWALLRSFTEKRASSTIGFVKSADLTFGAAALGLGLAGFFFGCGSGSGTGSFLGRPLFLGILSGGCGGGGGFAS